MRRRESATRPGVSIAPLQGSRPQMWPGTLRRRQALGIARHSLGFNVVELMAVIAIVSILLSLGTASYKYVTYANRVSSEINGLLGDLQVARSEAVRLGLPVSVCPSTNGTSCATTGGWEQGWVVFSDFNGDGNLDNATDAVLRVQKTFTSQDTLVPDDDTVTFVTFNREGFATSIPGADSANGVTFKLNSQPADTKWERCLNISWVGNMATQRPATSPTTCN